MAASPAASSATKRVGVYTRISQDREDRGLGVERQEDACRQDAERRGWEVVQVYRDNNISGSKRLKRPAYEQMLADAAAGRINALIAYDSARVTRDLREWAEFLEFVNKHALPVGFVTGDTGDITSAYGGMLASIVSVIANGETKKMSERVKAANAQKRASGAWLGGARPFGWDVVNDPDGFDDLGKPKFKAGRLVVNEAEKAEVVRACKAVIKGASLGSIAADWNARGIKPTGKADRWVQTTVRQVLLRPRNAGWLDHSGELVRKGEWKPLVSQKMWRDVERRLDPVHGAERHRTPRVANARKHLLSGLALCGECGATMKSAKAPNRDGTTRTIYRCAAVDEQTGRPVKGHPNRNAEPIEDKVVEFVIQRLLTSDPDALLYPARDVEQEALAAQAQEVEDRIDALTDAYRLGQIAIKPFTDTMAALQTDLERVEALRQPATNALVLEELVSPDSERALREAWEAMPLTRKRAVVEVLVTIRIFKSGRTGTRFDGGSVVVEPK